MENERNRDIAFAQMVERQRTMIEHVCSDYSMSAAWTVEDAVQEVLCTLWRDFGSYEGRSSERTWVYRVATNTMLMLKRRTSNRPQGEAPAHYEPTTESDEGYQLLMQLIDGLDQRDAQIVRAHLDGFNHREVAAVTGCSIPTVVRRLAAAKRTLRRQYEQACDMKK